MVSHVLVLGRGFLLVQGLGQGERTVARTAQPPLPPATGQVWPSSGLYIHLLGLGLGGLSSPLQPCALTAMNNHEQLLQIHQVVDEVWDTLGCMGTR